MTDLAVIFPSWSMERALTRCAEMMQLESRHRAEYVIVIPRAENLPIDEWVNGLDPEDAAITVLETDLYLSPVEAMARAGELLLSADRSARGPGHSPSDIFVFLHDDCIIEQPAWDTIVIDHFATHPRCGLAGFGGGIGFGHADIYKVPYHYTQLARLDFVSNMHEAHLHGRRVLEPTRVAALDGFSMITTRQFYDRAGRHEDVPFGLWDECLEDHIFFHMDDAWISCRAAELGYETWMIPVQCHHEGGQTSVAREADYAGVVARLGYESPQELYDEAHQRIYERFAGLLPIRVPKG